MTNNGALDKEKLIHYVTKRMSWNFRNNNFKGDFEF